MREQAWLVFSQRMVLVSSQQAELWVWVVAQVPQSLSFLCTSHSPLPASFVQVTFVHRPVRIERAAESCLLSMARAAHLHDFCARPLLLLHASLPVRVVVFPSLCASLVVNPQSQSDRQDQTW